MSVDLSNAYILDSEVGHFISEEHRHVAELINDYEPTLFLVWIPPDKRAFNEEFPFAILHRPEGHPEYIVRKVRENEVNADLIAWIWMNDQARGGKDVLSRVQAMEDAREAMKLKKQAEQAEANGDLAMSILKGKNYYRHNGRIYR
jgi:hypothetical protein